MARGTRKTEAPDPVVIEMRRSLARRIAARTRKEGEHKTAIPGLILYHRTSPTPCYEHPMSRVSVSLCRDGSGSISEARSICVMDHRFCCHRSTCLRKPDR